MLPSGSLGFCSVLQEHALGRGVCKYLDVLVGKQLLHLGAVRARHASVVDGKAVGQDVAQVGALAALCLLLQDRPAG